MILPVFKTGVRQVCLSKVRSTRTRFRQSVRLSAAPMLHVPSSMAAMPSNSSVESGVGEDFLSRPEVDCAGLFSLTYSFQDAVLN